MDMSQERMKLSMHTESPFWNCIQENVSPGWMVALRVSSAMNRLSPRYLIMHILSGSHPSLRRAPTFRSEENTAVDANNSESPD